jgi:hypothetical protein
MPWGTHNNLEHVDCHNVEMMKNSIHHMRGTFSKERWHNIIFLSASFFYVTTQDTREMVIEDIST